MDDALYEEMFRLEQQFWWFVAKHEIITHLIHRYLQCPAERTPVICDVGCGTGALLEGLSHEYEVLGIDSSDLARQFCRQRGLTVHHGILPDEISLSPDCCDVIVMSDVLEHLDQDRETVVRLVPALRPGGLLICTVPAHMWMWTKRDEFHHHRRRYRYKQYAQLFEQPLLKPVVISYYNAFLFPVQAAVRLLDRWRRLDDAKPDITLPAKPINSVLKRIFAFERHLLCRVNLPIGASLISVHRKIESTKSVSVSDPGTACSSFQSTLPSGGLH